MDGSGKLDVIELAMEMYKAKMRLLPPQSRGTVSEEDQDKMKHEGREDAEALLKKYDRDQSGSLDFHEFLAATCDPEWGALLPVEVSNQDVAALFKSEGGEAEGAAVNGTTGEACATGGRAREPSTQGSLRGSARGLQQKMQSRRTSASREKASS